jgi:hypothetical protein
MSTRIYFYFIEFRDLHVRMFPVDKLTLDLGLCGTIKGDVTLNVAQKVVNKGCCGRYDINVIFML